MRKLTGLFAALILVVATTVSAQSVDADIQRSQSSIKPRSTRGDAKALSQLFAENGLMIDGPK